MDICGCVWQCRWVELDGEYSRLVDGTIWNKREFWREGDGAVGAGDELNGHDNGLL